MEEQWDIHWDGHFIVQRKSFVRFIYGGYGIVRSPAGETAAWAGEITDGSVMFPGKMQVLSAFGTVSAVGNRFRKFIKILVRPINAVGMEMRRVP